MYHTVLQLLSVFGAVSLMFLCVCFVIKILIAIEKLNQLDIERLKQLDIEVRSLIKNRVYRSVIDENLREIWHTINRIEDGKRKKKV